MSAKSQYKDGKVGGVLVGRKHRDGGIKMKNVSTGEPIEAEGGEVIIMADAVADRTKHSFNGKQMTNREILSHINESAGGVALYKKGGQIEGPVKCGCSGKKHQYNGKEMTDREILQKMSEGGTIGREIKSANDFELLTPMEVFVLETYKQYKPAFRKKNIGQVISDSGYPYHEHLEKAEALIEQLKQFGFITPQNALSEQGKLALQKAKEKWAIPTHLSLPYDRDAYNKQWLPYFESTEMAKGGMVLEAQALRAKKADLIILPDNLKGTNCSNCQFVHIADQKTDQGYCKHPEVDQPVTARMCCIYWDAPGTERVWKHTGKTMQHGGAIGAMPAAQIISYQSGADVNEPSHILAKGGKIDLSDKYGKKLKLSDIPESVKTFMPLMQQKTISGSEEHWDVVERLARIIAEMPKTYETENIQSDDKIVYLHYFYGDSDWYIVEKDMEPEQLQAFGYVILNGDLDNAEWGYISIEEIKSTNKVELDFYFEPVKFGQLKQKWEGHENEAQSKAPSKWVDETQEITFGTDSDSDLVKFPDETSVDQYLQQAGLTEYMGLYEPGNEKMPEGIYAISPKTKRYLTWGIYRAALALADLQKPKQESGPTISEIAKASGDRIIIARPSHGQAAEEIRPQDIPQASIKTAKQQAAINQEIVNLIKSNGTDSSKYSASDIALIKQYSGAGGLSKHGASGPRILDQFFTPMDICSKMWGLAIQHGFNFKNTAMLEPSVGTGNFLQFIPRDAKVQVVGYEVDDISHSICQILFPQYDIRHDSFESMFFTGRRHIGLAGVSTFFDLVIGNPPYREYVSPYAKLGERDATGAFTFEMYFIMRGIDVLKPGGLLIYIIPNTFLSNDKKYNPFKTALAKKADLVDAYRLPNGVFDFTEVGTDILVLRKKK